MPTVTDSRLRPANIAPRLTETPWTLDVLGPPGVAFAVYGNPAPQGSKAFKGYRNQRLKDGRVVQVPNLQEQVQGVGPWRESVASVAVTATNVPGWEPLDGPLVVDMIFTLRRGSSIPKWRDWHFTEKDVSKLARSTEDALKNIVWVDDSRVSDYRRLAKRYVGSSDPDALRGPGAVIRVWQVPAALIEARKAWARGRA